MSLASRISDVVTSIGASIKDVQSRIGTLANLTTSDKTSLVAAVNEVKASIGASSGGSGGAAIGQVMYGYPATFDSTYLPCDGNAYLRTSYPTLAALDATRATVKSKASLVNAEFEQQTWVSVAMNGTLFTLVSANGLRLMTGSGTSFTAYTPNTNFASTAWMQTGSGYLIAPTAASATLLKASVINGTYASVTLTASLTWSCAAYGSSKFVVLASGGTVMNYSDSTGTTWTAGTIATGNWQQVVWSGTKFCAVNLNAAVTSAAGTTWTAAVTLDQTKVSAHSGIAWTGTNFVVSSRAAGTGTVAGSGNWAPYSADGVTWSYSQLPATADWACVASFGGVVMLFPNMQPFMALSVDHGVTWVLRNFPTGDWRRAGAASNGNFFVAGVKDAYLVTVDTTKFETPYMDAPNILIKPYIKAS